MSLWRFVNGKARFLKSDIVEFIQATGPQALPIVGIINLLLGVILGFMGAIQLQQFWAEIYVTDLVALGQTREIAPMMTAIVMAGRTGAAYAAQLGTMQVNEEIDALKTFGFSPMDFLVLPCMQPVIATSLRHNARDTLVPYRAGDRRKNAPGWYTIDRYCRTCHASRVSQPQRNSFTG